MPVMLNSADRDFSDRLGASLATKREHAPDVRETVSRILEAVRADGDRAVIAFSQQFDQVDLSAVGMRFSVADIAAAVAASDPAVLAALHLAHDRIMAYHARQIPMDDQFTDDLGVTLGNRWTAIESVGLYVPGGTASYPSSVLMNAVPAKVAGVPRIAMVVPTPKGEVNPLVLAAAHIAGITEIYRVGGAQAVGALAYGTATIPPVAKIVGPGNAYVAEAKRQVFGVVGIDTIAGPSEVLIVADHENDAEWVAADLLAQAEHDVAAQAILITDSADLAARVSAAVERQLKALPRGGIAGESWARNGMILTVASLEDAPALVDRIAPEHLELAVADPEALLPRIRNAGAIFLGHHTPEVIGDYVAGINHVLPTARAARFSSGLGVLDFMKRSSILKLAPDSLRALGPAAMRLAAAEGLDAHRRSVAIRLNLGDHDT